MVEYVLENTYKRVISSLLDLVCSADHRCWSCSHSFVWSISRKGFCQQLPSQLLRYVAIAIVHLVMEKVLCSEERLLVQLVAVVLVTRSSSASVQLRSLPQVQIHLRLLENFESSLSRLPYRTVPYHITHHRVNRSLLRTQK
jgi:hypothetical protein